MDYNETLLESMQLLIDSSLASQPRDEIVRCRITDITERDKGHYKVTSSDLVIFDAYSEKTTYRLDEEVNVLIPKNDQDKRQILGRYISQQDQPITYISGEEKLVSVETIYSQPQSDVKSITANNGTEMVSIVEITKGLEKSHLFNTLHIQADFKTLLSQYANTMRSGKYGLLALCYSATEDSSTLPAAVFELSSDHMFGNPYNYMTYFKQEYIFNYDISVPFERINLYLFQDNNFQYFDGKKLESVPKSNAPNILVSNIEMSFAYDVSNYDNQTVEIKTSDTLEYTNSEFKKDINLIWYNKTSENKYLGFDDGEFAEAAVKPVGYIESAQKFTQNADEGEEPKGFYYLQDMGYTQFFSEEKYEPGDKVYYTKKTHSDDEKSTVDGLAPEKPQYKIEWLVDNAEGVLTPQVTDDETAQSFILECRKDLTNTEVQAIIYRDGVAHKSNILKFVNKSIYDNNVSNLDISLDFKHLDNSLPAYAFYGQNNQLIDSTERFKRRRVQATWNSSAGDVSSAYWKGATITWFIPKNATMILPSPNQGMKETEDGKYTFSKTIETGANEEFQFEYLINSIFYANYINNQIECTLTLPGDRGSAHGVLSLAFSSFGTSGTSYTFIISPQKNKFPWTEYGENITTTASFGATLVDKNGEILNIDSIKWQYPYEKITTIEKDKTCEVTLSTLDDYTVLEASVEQEWGGKTTTLTATYPIVFSNGGKYYAQAPSEILYDSFGSLMNINFAPLKLFNLDSQEEIKDAIWGIYYTDPNNKLFAPAISYNSRTEEYTIVPPVMYVGNAPKVILRAKAQDNTILWQTPLVLTQYKYGSSILNDWNGELDIDNSNNYILSSMLGAGKKNDDNTFSGVLMGEVSNRLGTSSEGIGLYGYDHGAQAFGFKEDGTAFIGKSGTGRIQFDGDKGMIASNSWFDDKGELKNQLGSKDAGTMLNLKDGSLILQGKNGEHFNFNGEDGSLDIVVNKLDILSSMRGINLLKNGLPDGTDTVELSSYPKLPEWGNAFLNKVGNVSYIMPVDEDEPVTQTVNIEPGKSYWLTLETIYGDSWPGAINVTGNPETNINLSHIDNTSYLKGEIDNINSTQLTIGWGATPWYGTTDIGGSGWYVSGAADHWKIDTWTAPGAGYNPWLRLVRTEEDSDEGDNRLAHLNIPNQETIRGKELTFYFGFHYAVDPFISFYETSSSAQPITTALFTNVNTGIPISGEHSIGVVTVTVPKDAGVLTIGAKKPEKGGGWYFKPFPKVIRDVKLQQKFNNDKTPVLGQTNITNFMINSALPSLGMSLDNNQFVISATAIQSGALMSDNWLASGGAYGYSKDAGTDQILSHGSKGVAIDLRNGEISAESFLLVDDSKSSIGLSRSDGFVAKTSSGTPYVKINGTDEYYLSSTNYSYTKKSSGQSTGQLLYYYKYAKNNDGMALKIRTHPSNSNQLEYVKIGAEDVRVETDSNGTPKTLSDYPNWWYVRDYGDNRVNGYVYRYGVKGDGLSLTSSKVLEEYSGGTGTTDNDIITGMRIDFNEGVIYIGNQAGTKWVKLSCEGLDKYESTATASVEETTS